MTASSLTIFDWVLVALLTASTVRAFLRGFLLELFSVLGLVAGILLASWYYDTLAARLILWLNPLTTLAGATAAILAFLAIALGVMLLAGLAGKLLRSSASAVGLGLADRVLGAGFGLARGLLLTLAAIMVLTAFQPASRLIQDSQLLPYFLEAAHGVSFVVPGPLQRQLADGAERLKHNRDLWIKPPQ